MGLLVKKHLGAWEQEEKHLCDKTESALSERGSFSPREETLARE